MTSKKKTIAPQEPADEEILYSQCTPIVLVQDRKTIKQPTIDPLNPLLDAFQSEMRMGEQEAKSRIATYNEEVADLYDATMSGDELAAVLLVEYASVAIQTLEQISHRKPEALHQISVQNIRWPAFISQKEFDAEKNKQLRERLKLGVKSPLNHKWNPKSPATFTAYSLLYWLLENRVALQLPTLTKDTFEEWFEWGWKGFCHQLQGHPEKYQFLRNAVEHLAKAEIKRKQEKRYLETVIKRKMKGVLKQGFMTVTKNYLL
jgi:hypothetical protein